MWGPQAHNGNDGGEMEKWGPAMDALGALPNVYCKMGAIEEWGVDDAGIAACMDRAIAAFGTCTPPASQPTDSNTALSHTPMVAAGFEKVLYESNWFVSEASGDHYCRAAVFLKAACERAGATAEQMEAVFQGNARKCYTL